MITASTDIQYLKGVGEKRAVVLKNKGIDTVGALLRFYPRSYLDWTDISPISTAPFFTDVCVKAKVLSKTEERKRSGITLYSIVVEDSSAQMTVVLWGQKFLANSIREGREYLFYGKITGGFLFKQMSSPKIVPAVENGIEPIYPASKNMSSKQIERLIKTAVAQVRLPETIPEEIRERNRLCTINYAIENIHFPISREAFLKAQKRLVFEELFILRTGLSLLKSKKGKKAGSVIKQGYLAEFKALLPFNMTSAQERVIKECMRDMFSGTPMSRLVQGDVGSGKTVIAAALMYSAAKNGFQSCLMAPTEILANQHYKTLLKITENTGIRCALMTGSVKIKEKNTIKAALKKGEIDVVVGTHALITKDVEFNKLGLVVTDEQHRFGVGQRGSLALKGENPHKLVMSATPIPGTLGLILYGDLDVSIVDEYPAGRQKIDTYLVDTSYRERIYRYIKKFLDDGRQGYIVCPLVEENDEVDITSATEYYVNLKNNQFKNYSVGLLHGKMSAKEKDEVMRQFSDGEIQLLIATTVIEVGIDVPNAVIMVIENAERFGLSQLHQLRGRIGRGEYKSDCILITDNTAEDTLKRLEIIKKNTDGFKIADEDLRLRGPGNFLGSRQHGLPPMKIADLFADKEVLELAGKEAENLLETDPDLRKNEALKTEILDLYKKLNKE
ncbi:MAG: ATP-dependent DNA helicase RecG [Clostridia bacterium]|nr:ATP-dependent DNA helicase RecG [Clostridia bacterium]